jgi:HAD superfamily hydrolase (TIGR01484 family)
MKPLKSFSSSDISYVFTDIDGTLTTADKISGLTYQSLWSLKNHGVQIIPVTGRPAGWCELIARQWPVHGVIGENGAFYFRHTQNEMKRHFFSSQKDQENFRSKLKQIESEVLKQVKGSKVASDQFSRLFDLAIDFAEDVTPPLSHEQINQIVKIFEKHGATCKVSHIHVNGWFGNQNKGDACFEYARKELGLKTEKEIQLKCAYVGDSPNDEPLFERFENSFGVANVVDYQEFMKVNPKYVSPSREGDGFVEIANHLLKLKS